MQHNRHGRYEQMLGTGMYGGTSTQTKTEDTIDGKSFIRGVVIEYGHYRMFPEVFKRVCGLCLRHCSTGMSAMFSCVGTTMAHALCEVIA